MELDQIREILGGIKVPAEVRRQAWYETGERGNRCPHPKGSKLVGVWMAEQGLDFIRPDEMQKARLMNKELKVLKPEVLAGCPESYPANVLTWMRKHGHISCRRRTARATVQAVEPVAQEPVEVTDRARQLAKVIEAMHVWANGFDDAVSGAIDGSGQLSAAEVSELLDETIRQALKVVSPVPDGVHIALNGGRSTTHRTDTGLTTEVQSLRSDNGVPRFEVSLAIKHGRQGA